MEYVLVTVRYVGKEADLELPISVPLYVLTPLFLEALAWPEGPGGDRLVGRIERTGLVIRPHETLAQLNIAAGDIVTLTAVRGDVPVVSVDDESPPPPARPGRPFLRAAANGAHFPCPGRAVLLGRGSEAHVDLAALPGGGYVSHRHANIVRREDGFWISDVGSRNGTIVDGVLLRTGENLRLREGSQIQLGERGPLLTFHTGKGEPSGSGDESG